MFKERIEYDNPKTLEEAMRKENSCWGQNKNKRENVPTWKSKRPNNFDPRKKQNKFHKTHGLTIKDIKVVITTKLLNHIILL